MGRGRTAPSLVAALVACAALAGCGGGSDAGSDGSSGGSATGKGGEELTELGTTLKMGEPAVIAYTDEETDASSIIRLTPKTLEKGSPADLEGAESEEELEPGTPFYVPIEVENLGEGDLSGTNPAAYINAVDTRGQKLSELSLTGAFEPCDPAVPTKIEPGASYETCLTYVVPEGVSITGLRWVQFDQSTGKTDLRWK